MNRGLRQRRFLMLLAAAAAVLMVNIALESLNQGMVPAATTAPVKQIEPVVPPAPVLFQYIEIIDSCGPYYGGKCVNARSGPGEEYRTVARLRNGMVLKVGGTVERGGRTWYRVVFDEGLLYPERVSTHWYVAGDYVRSFSDEGVINLEGGASALTDSAHSTSSVQASSPQVTKRILVDRSLQMLYAYEGDALFMQVHISAGLALTPTPRGTVTAYKKTPTRYMQGPLPGVSDQFYDLPGVPWDLYFTYQGAAIHGAYWHDKFGKRWSHGCVNLPLEEAHKLYEWSDVGTPVIVRD